VGRRRYEIYGPAFQADPYAVYARMREEAPVVRQPGIDGETPIWFVTRYEDVSAVLLDDRRLVRDPRCVLTPEELAARPPEFTNELIESHMLNRDGDDHRRLRRLVTKAFTPRMVESLRPRIHQIADELIDRVASRGTMDLVEEYAFPLPITVIAELLGVPAADRDRFRTWSATVITPAFGPDASTRFMEQMSQFTGYLADLFARRRAEPRDDLVSALIEAEEHGETLSEPELYSMVMLLIVAGHETTVNLIANGALALIHHPEELDRLRATPESMPDAIEELLRYDGPVERTLNRWAAEDVELAGEVIPRGEMVIAVLGSADRDPAQFPEPDRLDLGRRENRHVAFGRGAHYCLGAPLARLEGAIALKTLLRRLPGLRLAVRDDELDYRPTPTFRSLTALPVAWD
jgi:cytochrome P450 PksS